MTRRSLVAFVLSTLLFVTGCPGDSQSVPAPAPSTAPAPAPNTAPAPAPAGGGQRVSAAEWCAEHGVPEAVCTRCNASLIDSYKAKNDWCAEHGLPESQCIPCNPEVKAKWDAMAPSAQ